MESNQPKTNVKDFFLNLGAIVALYTTVISLISLLFTVINNAYPQITAGYRYALGSQSISMPVATLIIFFPIFILLMWLLEKGYVTEPEKKQLGIRKWLSYITLFIAGIILAGDLVTVLYYFIDGQEITTGFLLKILSVFVIIFVVFYYYISDIRNKLTSMSRKGWLSLSAIIIVLSVVWGFSVLGSPRTQQLLKYDEQKVNDLQNMNSAVINYWQTYNVLPGSISELVSDKSYYFTQIDQQTGKSYEYNKISDNSYELCADFNKSLNDTQIKGGATRAYPGAYGITWSHTGGRYCFKQTVVEQPIPAANVRNIY